MDFAPGVLFILLACGFALMYAYTPRTEPPDDGLIVVGALVVFFLEGAVLSCLTLSTERSYLSDAAGIVIQLTNLVNRNCVQPAMWRRFLSSTIRFLAMQFSLPSCSVAFRSPSDIYPSCAKLYRQRRSQFFWASQ